MNVFNFPKLLFFIPFFTIFGGEFQLQFYANNPPPDGEEFGYLGLTGEFISDDGYEIVIQSKKTNIESILNEDFIGKIFINSDIVLEDIDLPTRYSYGIFDFLSFLTAVKNEDDDFYSILDESNIPIESVDDDFLNENIAGAKTAKFGGYRCYANPEMEVVYFFRSYEDPLDVASYLGLVFAETKKSGSDVPKLSDWHGIVSHMKIGASFGFIKLQ